MKVMDIVQVLTLWFVIVIYLQVIPDSQSGFVVSIAVSLVILIPIFALIATAIPVIRSIKSEEILIRS